MLVDLPEEDKPFSTCPASEKRKRSFDTFSESLVYAILFSPF